MSSSKNLEGLPGFKFDPATGNYIVVPLDVKALFGSQEKEKSNTGWSSGKKSKGNSNTKTMGSPYKFVNLPGIEIDPVTGKYTIVPCDFKAVFGNNADNEIPKSGTKGSKKMKDTYSPKPTKFRKVEMGARKQLFKVPAGNRLQATESPKNAKRKMSFTSSGKSFLPTKNNLNGAVKNPSGKKKVFAMETIAEQSFKPSILITPPTPLLSRVNKEVIQESKTPDSEEFMKLEQLCKTPKVSNESPVSSVCNLFESKMLLGEEKERTESVKNRQMTRKQIAQEMSNIAKANQKLSEDISKKMKEVMDLQAIHQKNLQTIIALEEKLNETNVCDTDEDNKENNTSIRRSLRLKNKSPSQPSERASNAAVSPVILKAGDLRKSTLTKSLVSKCNKYQIESPRMQKALAMYNSTRNTLGTLLTPKMSRNEFESSTTRSCLRENLSIKVQQQCLMLQDTPNVK